MLIGMDGGISSDRQRTHTETITPFLDTGSCQSHSPPLQSTPAPPNAHPMPTQALTDTLQRVELADGVEIHLRIAGPAARSVAWLVDCVVFRVCSTLPASQSPNFAHGSAGRRARASFSPPSSSSSSNYDDKKLPCQLCVCKLKGGMGGAFSSSWGKFCE